MTAPLLRRIGDVLSSDDTVLFVGSGVSCWSGLPDWPQLLAALAVYVEDLGRDSTLLRRELAKGEYLMAADFAVDVLSAAEFGAFLRNELHRPGLTPSRLHQLLVDLGPTCFITTSYDRLLEDTLVQHRPGEPFDVVTNQHVIETANIMRARSTRFLFKPHGDVGDVESIVLSNRHYTWLRNRSPHTIEALKVLLASRPVVFVGFSLRDPGFRLVADNLLATFEAGLEHYAVMADVDEAEADFWRRNYGTQIVSYATAVLPDGQVSHEGLYQLLSGLREQGAAGAGYRPATARLSGPAVELSLIRYTNSLVSLHDAVADPLPLLATPRASDPSDRYAWPIRLARLLRESPGSFVLAGSPGAGKSHGMRHATKSLAARGRDVLVAGSDSPVAVPVFIDLRQYEGSVRAMIQDALPTGLEFSDLQAAYPCRLFLDAANEVPEEHETTIVQDLLSFVRDVHPHVVVISTRYVEQFQGSGLDVFTVDAIDWDFVAQLPEIRDVDLAARHDIVGILTRPFFYQLFRQGAIDVNGARTPTDLLASQFRSITARARAELGAAADIESALRLLAFAAIESGREMLDAAAVIAALSAAAPGRDGNATLAWLVRNGVMFALPGRKVAFAHQLLTEYLAAAEVAARYVAEPNLLKTWLSSRTWDQALLLAASMLDGEAASSFVDGLLSVDFHSAARAVSYLESGRREVTTAILEWLVGCEPSEDQLHFSTWDIAMLPVEDVHLPLLWTISAKGDLLGGAVAQHLVRLGGRAAVEKLLAVLFERPKDFNLLQDVGRALADVVTTEDLRGVIQRLSAVTPSEDEDEWAALEAGVALMLVPRPVAEVLALFDESRFEGIQAHVLAEYLQDKSSVEAFHAAARLIDRDPSFAVTVYFQVRFGDYGDDDFNAVFSDALLRELLSYIITGRGDVRRWAADALAILAGPGVRWRDAVLASVPAVEGWARLSLAYAAGSNPQAMAELIEALLDEAEGPLPHPEMITVVPPEAWRAIGEDIVTRVLQLGDVETTPAMVDALDEAGRLMVKPDLEPLSGWIELLCRHDEFFYQDRLGRLIGTCATKKQTRELVAMLPDRPEARGPVVVHVLPHVSSLMLDELDDDVIRLLLDVTLSQDMAPGDQSGVGQHASKAFVRGWLLPLLANDDLGTGRRRALVAVLRECGDRHSRRYVTVDGSPM